MFEELCYYNSIEQIFIYLNKNNYVRLALQIWSICRASLSSCCTNVDKVPSSSETHDTGSSDLSANKSKDSSSDNPSTEYKPAPFPSLGNHFTPPSMKTVSPISVTETENDDSNEELNKDDEVSSNEKDESTKMNKITPPPCSLI